MTGPRPVDPYYEEVRSDGLFIQRGSEIVTACCLEEGCDWRRSHGAAISGGFAELGALAESVAFDHVRATHHQVSVNRELALISPGKTELELVR